MKFTHQLYLVFLLVVFHFLNIINRHEIPTECPGVPGDLLVPRNTWDNKNDYDDIADNLVSMFKENFLRYSSGVSEDVNTAGPV